MSDVSILSAEGTDELLHAVSDKLAARGEQHTVVIVGGSALLARPRAAPHPRLGTQRAKAGYSARSADRSTLSGFAPGRAVATPR